MTEKELEQQFDKEFECECRERVCDFRDCCECEVYFEAYEDYRQELGYEPRILVGL